MSQSGAALQAYLAACPPTAVEFIKAHSVAAMSLYATTFREYCGSNHDVSATAGTACEQRKHCTDRHQRISTSILLTALPPSICSTALLLIRASDRH
eukprot:7399-Heterococcus_DN1.PRE.3